MIDPRLQLKLSTMLVLGLGLAFAPACDGGDDDGGDTANEDESSDSGDGDSGDGDSGDGDTGDQDTGDGDTGDGDGGTDTGELMGCAAVDNEDDCVNESGCGPVYGVAVVEDGEGAWCTTAEEQFIGCGSASDLCPMLGKILCDSELNVFQTTDCVPGNLLMCEPPGGVTGPCA